MAVIGAVCLGLALFFNSNWPGISLVVMLAIVAGFGGFLVWRRKYRPQPAKTRHAEARMLRKAGWAMGGALVLHFGLMVGDLWAASPSQPATAEQRPPAGASAPAPTPGSQAAGRGAGSEMADVSFFKGFSLVKAVVDLLKDLPGWIFSFGFGSIFVFYLWSNEPKHYIQEVVEATLKSDEIFAQFTPEAQKKFLDRALKIHSPDFATQAIVAQIEQANHRPALGRKNIISYDLHFSAMPPDAAGGLLKTEDYLMCVFAERYQLRLSGEEKDFEYVLTFDERQLAEHFGRPGCIFRDLIMLSPKDRAAYGALIASDPVRAAEITRLFQASLQFQIAGQEETQTVPLELQADAKGLRFTARNIHARFGAAATVEVTSEVRCPLSRTVGGYPLLFMSYSHAPQVEIAFDRDTGVQRNSYVSFLSCSDPSCCVTSYPRGAGKNPPQTRLKIKDGKWVLPGSGIYITWEYA